MLNHVQHRGAGRVLSHWLLSGSHFRIWYSAIGRQVHHSAPNKHHGQSWKPISSHFDSIHYYPLLMFFSALTFTQPGVYQFPTRPAWRAAEDSAKAVMGSRLRWDHHRILGRVCRSSCGSFLEIQQEPVRPVMSRCVSENGEKKEQTVILLGRMIGQWI